ncbi:MAG: heavy-metal-associated domain-containing protein [candidate division Zixibacteria bacterium]|nr:heavy-metal-associated domain-containing protein [candidate division Zixibacteria bacterium]
MDNNKIKLSITGMTCGGCAAAVKQALLTVPRVSAVEVDLPTKTATITFSGAAPTSKELIDTVQQVGYAASLSD